MGTYLTITTPDPRVTGRHTGCLTRGMQRREFCLRALKTTSGAACGSLLGGCVSGLTSPSTEFSLPIVEASRGRGGETIAIDPTSPLASIGGAALVDSARGPLLVVRTSADAFAAMGASCTHEGCTITEFRDRVFECHCHGSQFDATGAVVRGPARRPLSRFATTFTDDILTISW